MIRVRSHGCHTRTTHPLSAPASPRAVDGRPDPNGPNGSIDRSSPTRPDPTRPRRRAEATHGTTGRTPTTNEFAGDPERTRALGSSSTRERGGETAGGGGRDGTRRRRRRRRIRCRIRMWMWIRWLIGMMTRMRRTTGRVTRAIGRRPMGDRMRGGRRARTSRGMGRGRGRGRGRRRTASTRARRARSRRGRRGRRGRRTRRGTTTSTRMVSRRTSERERVGFVSRDRSAGRSSNRARARGRNDSCTKSVCGGGGG